MREGRSSARALICSGRGARVSRSCSPTNPPASPQSEIDEAVIADDDLLQAQELVEVDWLASGLADGAAPALHAVLRRVFALDDVAGA